MNTLNYYDNTCIKVDQFGAIGNCKGFKDISLTESEIHEVTGNDDTTAFQSAVDYCIKNHKKLILHESKHYRITDTIIINGKLSIIGNYAYITADILDKNKPLFLIKNNSEEEICNLHLLGNYICKAGIEFQQPDNQMLTIKNVNIGFFRNGLFCEQSECLNRLIIDKCEIINNLLTGICFKSGTISSISGHSVPVRINDTLIHTNGFGPLAQTGYVGGIKIITTETRNNIYQIYLIGIGNLLITGGQLTAGNDKPTGALLWGKRVSNLCMIDVETEQFNLADTNGYNTSDYDKFIGTNYGGALHIESSQNINIQVNGHFSIYSDCFIKLVNCYGVCSLKTLAKSDTTIFLIDIAESNYNYKSSGGAHQLILDTNSPMSYLSPNSLFAIDKNKFDLLTNIGYLTPHLGSDYHFTYSENNGSQYILKGITDTENPDFSKACYIKKICHSPSVILVILDMYEFLNEGTGRFYIQYLDKDNNVIGYDILNPKDSWKAQSGNTFIKRFALYPPNNIDIVFIKYGFINIGSNAAMNSVDTLKIKGFKVYVGYDSKVNQWNDNRNICHDENYSIGFIENNMLSWGIYYPTYGFHKKGEIVFNCSPVINGNLGWICIETGTPGVWKNFGLIAD